MDHSSSRGDAAVNTASYTVAAMAETVFLHNANKTAVVSPAWQVKSPLEKH